MNKFTGFLKREPVFCASAALALISCAFVPPDAGYAGYVDIRTIALLYCLMVTVAGLTEAGVLSAEAPATYAYYFAHIKPKPQPAAKQKTGFVCEICGYVYEGETLPPDFICPLCKHDVEAFRPLAPAAPKKKGFVCRICGYVYEGDVLPPDFTCPLCKHGAEDFEPLP